MNCFSARTLSYVKSTLLGGKIWKTPYDTQAVTSYFLSVCDFAAELGAGAHCSGRGGRDRSARRARPAFGGLVSRGEVASAAPLLGAGTREPEREPLEEEARPLGVSESWICGRGFSVASALGPGGLSRLSPLLSELRLCPRVLSHRGQGHIPALASEPGLWGDGGHVPEPPGEMRPRAEHRGQDVRRHGEVASVHRYLHGESRSLQTPFLFYKWGS